MKKWILGLGLLIIASCANEGSTTASKQDSAQANAPVKDSSKKSIPAQASQTIDGSEIRIDYYSPAVRGRVIWGGLVPYGTVWVTGAHKATAIEFDKDLVIENKTIASGKYALFTIPEKEEWTIIINKNWNQHLADDYAEGEDIVRFKVKPQQTDSLVERLRYDIIPKGSNAADVVIQWERKKISFPVKVQ